MNESGGQWPQACPASQNSNHIHALKLLQRLPTCMSEKWCTESGLGLPLYTCSNQVENTVLSRGTGRNYLRTGQGIRAACIGVCSCNKPCRCKVAGHTTHPVALQGLQRVADQAQQLAAQLLRLAARVHHLHCGASMALSSG